MKKFINWLFGQKKRKESMNKKEFTSPLTHKLTSISGRNNSKSLSMPDKEDQYKNQHPYSAQSQQDDLLNPLNPVSPLNPLSPLSIWNTNDDISSGSNDSYNDGGNSHDSGGSSSYDSGGNYDSGSSSDSTSSSSDF